MIIKSTLKTPNLFRYSDYHDAEKYDQVYFHKRSNRRCFCIDKNVFLFYFSAESYDLQNNENWDDELPSESEIKLFHKLKKLHQI